MLKFKHGKFDMQNAFCVPNLPCSISVGAVVNVKQERRKKQAPQKKKELVFVVEVSKVGVGCGLDAGFVKCGVGNEAKWQAVVSLGQKVDGRLALCFLLKIKKIKKKRRSLTPARFELALLRITALT